MIIVTGAYGFIGSYLVSELNKLGYGRSIVVVDDFYKSYKEKNLDHKKVREWIHRDIFLDWFQKNAFQIEKVIHLGARTDTAEKNVSLFENLNLQYSKVIWAICSQYDIPLVYASSAATYGDGALGFNDSDTQTPILKALNPYGDSKLSFDQWVLSQKESPSKWIGLRFFNVYGPNEYHKGRMASVIFHSFNQVKATGKMKLFRSHKKSVKDGEQLRDFIYIKDVVKVILTILDDSFESGIYNLGTGQARTFLDLTNATFSAMELESNIEFIDIPSDIRDSYQYYTEADMHKLKSQIKGLQFTSLEEGVKDYVQNYLLENFKIH